MAGVVTIFRLAEECLRIISGGNPPVASKVHLAEIKLAIGQVCNSLLKAEYFQINTKLGEAIPNGTILGLYEGILVTPFKNVSQCFLPVKPLRLPRNMGVFSIFDSNNPFLEFIPLEMGQWSLLQSQPLLNDLMGQVGYENFGMQIVFTKDITLPISQPQKTVSMRLALMDVSLYGDFDPLPILPEQEFEVKRQVCAMYGAEVVADKVVDAGHKEQKGVPLPQQAQT